MRHHARHSNFAFRGLPLWARLASGLVLVSMFVGSVGVVSTVELLRMQEADKQLYESHTAPLPLLAELALTFDRKSIAVRDLLGADTAAQNAAFADRIARLTKDIDRQIVKCQAKIRNLSLNERAVFAQFLAARSAYASLLDRVVVADRAGRADAGWAILWSPEYATLSSHVLGSLDAIQTLEIFDAQKAIKANNVLAGKALIATLTVAAFGLILAVAVGFWLSVSITRPIARIMRMLEAVAAGDLSQRLVITSADEIGRMALTLNTTIAALKESREELTDAREAALAASTAKSAFLSSMSHEIRTPMNAILGMSEVLDETPLTDEQRRFLGIMRSNGSALLDLINDILDLSKVESGRLVLEHAAFDLETLVESTVETFSLRAHERGLELATHINGDVPTNLLGDSLRLRQIIINLVGNALKFTEHGEVVVSVACEESLDETAKLHFTVRDTGIGIPPDKVDAIFANFTQVDSSISRKYGGTGLGLAIVKQLVELMGGRIWVESEEGRGSVFHFTAQLDRCAGPIAAAAPPAPDMLVGVRTLVVDDNATNRLILREMLGRAGAIVSEAIDGPTALVMDEEAATAGQSYQLILLDCRMPGMDGFEVARKLPHRAGRIVLMLSSDQLGTHLARARESGLDAYLIKPIKRVELFKAIAATLDRSPAGAVVPGAVEALANRDLRLNGVALKLLVADDSPDNLLLIRAFLAKAPVELDEAENGYVAITKFTGGSYDLILMDVQMPVMDGLTAIRRIRAIEASHGMRPTPIAALTASVFGDDIRKCIDAGADRHVAKPIKKKALLELIAEMTGSARPAKALGEPVESSPSA